MSHQQIQIGSRLTTVEVDYTYDYCPGDRDTPPTASLTINEVTRKGVDVTDITKALGFMDEIEELIMLSHDKNYDH